MDALVPLLLFVLGYVNQRGSTCAVAAMDRLIDLRRWDSLAGFAVAASASSFAMLAFGSPIPPIHDFGLETLGGGVLVAIGAAINGRCAMGTVSSLSRGNLVRLATLFCFLLGAVLAIRFGLRPAGLAKLHPMPVGFLALGCAAIVLLTGWHLAQRVDGPGPVWMLAIGVLNMLLYALATDWTYTGRLVALANGDAIRVFPFLVGMAALVAGGAFAAHRMGVLSIGRATAGDWARAGLGGLLMGLGAAIVPGGNDTMLLIGIPLLVPHLILAYGAFLTTMLVIRQPRLRRMLR